RPPIRSTRASMTIRSGGSPRSAAWMADVISAADATMAGAISATAVIAAMVVISAAVAAISAVVTSAISAVVLTSGASVAAAGPAGRTARASKKEEATEFR